MNITQKRLLLFTLLCIPSRVFFLYLAKTLTGTSLVLFAMLAFLISVGFMYIYVTGSRQVGAETIGQHIWWNSLRPVHSLLYLSFALLALNNSKNAHTPLAIDVVLGFTSFVVNHFVVQ